MDTKDHISPAPKPWAQLHRPRMRFKPVFWGCLFGAAFWGAIYLWLR